MSQAARMGRRLALRTMVDRCVVHRNAGDPDPLTGEVAKVQVYPNPSWPADHPYKAGPAKSQSYEAYERNPEAGGHSYTVQRYSAHFPVDAFTVLPGDVITWTRSETPALTGRRDRVTAPFEKTSLTAQRVFVDRMAD